MNLSNWEANGWLRKHETSFGEINNHLMIVDRDLQDASEGISADWRFGIAYNAALKLCTILLYAEGYKAEPDLTAFLTVFFRYPVCQYGNINYLAQKTIPH